MVSDYDSVRWGWDWNRTLFYMDAVELARLRRNRALELTAGAKLRASCTGVLGDLLRSRSDRLFCEDLPLR